MDLTGVGTGADETAVAFMNGVDVDLQTLNRERAAFYNILSEIDVDSNAVCVVSAAALLSYLKMLPARIPSSIPSTVITFAPTRRRTSNGDD